MKRLVAMILLLVGVAVAQNAGSEDILGVHNLGVASNPVKGLGSNACLYCHAPHSGQSKGPLWGQTYSGQTYTMYHSDTLQNSTTQPELGKSSSLCLSCHDGTIAPGHLVPSGTITVIGTMTSTLPVEKLENSHPFSLKLPLKDSADLVANIFQSQTTADPTKTVRLVGGNVECTSCHNPHTQRLDPLAADFLVTSNKNGDLCKTCHETTQNRTVSERMNPLAQWSSSVHALSSAQVAPTAKLGGYSTVGEFACGTCHVQHDAAPASGLLRKSTTYTGVDSTSQACLKCHDGSKSLVSPIANILIETQKRGHPFANTSNPHSPGEAISLNDNRHATCVDCHDGHAAKPTSSFSDIGHLRPSQNGASGVKLDGTLLARSATMQYETCLRCHGTSTGQQTPTSLGYLPQRQITGGAALNVALQFNTQNSTHPVMTDPKRQVQPSLLPSMLDVTGKLGTRSMGGRLLCTDCHNGENNREFGGIGPNGPHGSNNDHLLERRYVASEVTPGNWPDAGPGTLIKNLYVMRPPYADLDPSANGPYALCTKCHDLQKSVIKDRSFPHHKAHVQIGVSCSVCHTAHGVPSGLPSKALINFDVRVVAPYQGSISYANGTCTLTCHMYDHSPQGVFASDPKQPRVLAP